jgi:hypothetical protein
MKTILMLIPLTLALSACNQFGAQNSEFAAMGKGSIAQPSELPPENTFIPDGSTVGGTDGSSSGVEPKQDDVVVVTDGGSFGGSSGGVEPTKDDVVVVTDGGSFGGSSGGVEPTKDDVVIVTDGGSFGGSSGGVEPKKEDAPVQKVLCLDQGLQGTLWDASNMSKTPKFSDAVSNGIKIQSPIFLPDLNIARMENPGFRYPDGAYVLNQAGNILKERFGLQLDSKIILSDDEEDGFYQIAINAEDEVRVEFNGQVLDQQASSGTLRFFRGQGMNLYEFELKKGMSFPIKIQLSQSKKEEYSIMLLWRRVRDANGFIVPGAEEADLREKTRSGRAASNDMGELMDASQTKIPWSLIKPFNYKLPDGVCK